MSFFGLRDINHLQPILIDNKRITKLNRHRPRPMQTDSIHDPDSADHRYLTTTNALGVVMYAYLPAIANVIRITQCAIWIKRPAGVLPGSKARFR